MCEDSGFLSTILLAKTILEILCIVVPIILIVMLAIDLSKIIMGGDLDRTVKIVSKSIISKTLAAVAIFFVPTLVNLLLSMVNEVSYNASACWTNANSTTIAQFKAIEEARRIQEKEELGKASEEAKKERERVNKLREEARKENEEAASENGGIMLGDVVYYNQCDYKDYAYGSYGTICSHGCGPTSAAVIASTFLGSKGRGPVEVTKWVCSHGGCTQNGSYGNVCADYLKEQGLNVSKQIWWSSEAAKDLQQKLATGDYLALILVHDNTKRNIFTSGGHYFVLTGVKNGEFTIAQVSRPAQNNQTWPLSAFHGDAVYFYLVSKN